MALFGKLALLCNRRVATSAIFCCSYGALPGCRRGCGPAARLMSYRGFALCSSFVTGRGFRFGEAQHPGPLPSSVPLSLSGGPPHLLPPVPHRPAAFLCPPIPRLSQEQSPPTRVLSRPRGGRPKSQSSIRSFFRPLVAAPVVAAVETSLPDVLFTATGLRLQP